MANRRKVVGVGLLLLAGPVFALGDGLPKVAGFACNETQVGCCIVGACDAQEDPCFFDPGWPTFSHLNGENGVYRVCNTDDPSDSCQNTINTICCRYRAYSDPACTVSACPSPWNNMMEVCHVTSVPQ